MTEQFQLLKKASTARHGPGIVLAFDRASGI